MRLKVRSPNQRFESLEITQKERDQSKTSKRRQKLVLRVSLLVGMGNRRTPEMRLRSHIYSFLSGLAVSSDYITSDSHFHECEAMCLFSIDLRFRS